MVLRFQNSANSTTGPKVAPKPAQAKDTIWKTELFLSQARTTATAAISTKVTFAIIMEARLVVLMRNRPLMMFSDTLEEAAKS